MENLSVEEFIKIVIEKDNKSNINIASVILKELYKRILNKDITFCNSLFKILNPISLSENANISFLTFTLVNKKLFLFRDKFYKEFEDYSISQFGNKYTELLLRGLK